MLSSSPEENWIGLVGLFLYWIGLLGVFGIKNDVIHEMGHLVFGMMNLITKI